MMPPIINNDIKLYNTAQIKKRKKQIRKNLNAVLLLAAMFIVSLQIFPLAISYITGLQIHAQVQENPPTLPVTKSFFESIFSVRYTDPGTEYFERLTQKALEETPKSIPIDVNYKNPMYISIPSLKIDKILLTPNVPSTPKEIYEQALSKGVAHLKNTPLPGAGGNSIIYGHSGLTSLLRRNYPGIVFTKLERIKIGDMIYINKDGATLAYKVVTKKIIPPEDLKTIVAPSQNDKITLVTCWPVGIGSQRLVVTAYRDD